MPFTYGPYTLEQIVESLRGEALALAARKQLEREYRRPVGVPMPEALNEYEVHLRVRGNVKNRPNKPRTVETTMQRLRGVFVTDIITGDLTAKVMIDLWSKWVTGKATDTALNTLAQVRTFLGWLEKKQWTKGAPVLQGIEVDGIRKKGKPKLSQDEAETLVNWCLMGHESETTTTEHYAGRTAVAQSGVERVTSSMN